MREDSRFDMLRFYERIAVSRSTVCLEQCLAECGKDCPIGVERVYIGVGDTAVEMCAEVVQVFGLLVSI